MNLPGDIDSETESDIEEIFLSKSNGEDIHDVDDIVSENRTLIRTLRNENAAMKKKMLEMGNSLAKNSQRIDCLHEEIRKLNSAISNSKNDYSAKSTQSFWETKSINLLDPRSNQSFTMNLNGDNLLPVADLREKIGPVSYLKYPCGKGHQCIFPPNEYFYPPADGWGKRIYQVIVPPNVISFTNSANISTISQCRWRCPLLNPNNSHQQPINIPLATNSPEQVMNKENVSPYVSAPHALIKQPVPLNSSTNRAGITFPQSPEVVQPLVYQQPVYSYQQIPTNIPPPPH